MGIIYDGSGRQVGRVSGDFLYDGSGRQIGRISGDFLYDESGRQIGRWDGVRRRDVICFFYFHV
ncbi:MAG: 5-fold beta-flower protein [Alphaproteobacteria bacterium]